MPDPAPPERMGNSRNSRDQKSYDGQLATTTCTDGECQGRGSDFLTKMNMGMELDPGKGIQAKRKAVLVDLYTVLTFEPPLTRMTWPLIHSAASLQRKPTTGATSIGSPIRPIGHSPATATMRSSDLPA
uniref:Uncharacterized protein n=1 Tax=Leersia perrieri TaxID=77586 RepID=A0A0D9WMP5_9ORYZ